MADLSTTTITGGIIQKSGTNTVSAAVAIKPYLDADYSVFESTNSVSFVSSAYDINADKIVVAYRDDTDGGKGKAVVGTISAVSVSPPVITWGTPVTFANYATTHTAGQVLQAYIGPAIAYDVNAEKMVIAWSKGNRNPVGVGTAVGKGTSKVGTVSGTGTGATITFSGSEGDWDTSGLTPDDLYQFHNQLIYDPNAQKMVITWHGYGATNTQGTTGMQGWVSVGTVSGTSISWGTPVLIESDATSGYGVGSQYGAEYVYVSLVYDAASQNIVFTWEGSVLISSTYNSNSKFRVGTVSGTSITFGSTISHILMPAGGLGDADASSLSYDTVAQKIVVVYTDYSVQIGDRWGTARVGTVSGTGTGGTIALGLPVAYTRVPTRANDIVYNTNAQKHQVTWVNYIVTDPQLYHIQSKMGTVTSVTLTCTTTNSSTTVTTASTSSLAPGMSISGTGMGAGSDTTTVTFIASITNATTFVLSANATATGSTSLIFTSISFSTATTIQSTGGIYGYAGYPGLGNPTAYDSSTYRMAVSRPSPNPSVMITHLKASAITVDLSTGGVFTLDLQNTDGPGIVSFTVSNVDQTTDRAQSFILKITQGSHGSGLASGFTTRQIIWSELTNFKWPSDGGPPTLTATDNAVDILSFTTYDRGVTWHGSVVGQNFT